MPLRNENKDWKCDEEKMKEIAMRKFSDLLKENQEKGVHNYCFLLSYLFGESSSKHAHCLVQSRDQ